MFLDSVIEKYLKPSVFQLAFCFFLVVPLCAQSGPSSSHEEAIRVLNQSPWARRQTEASVVEGVGSGLYGEKEIFNRYFVRLASAEPIRDAYRTINDLLQGETPAQETASGNGDILGELPEDYLVFVVTFRSNDPEREREVQRMLEAQTTNTLRTRAYLSTKPFPQLEIETYFRPLETAVGAKFVFPKRVEGQPIVLEDEESFVFEVDFPEESPDLRVTFPVTEAIFPASVQSSVSPLVQLQNIEEFRIQKEHSGSLVDLQSTRLADLVNVFPMQAGGTIHGSIYEFHRNDALDARNFFDPVGEPLPEFKRNQFGIGLGISLGRRLNIFGSYDGTRTIRGSTKVSHVPTPEMKSGDFSLAADELGLTLIDPLTQQPFPNNRIPQNRIHTVSQGLLSLFPDPNLPDPTRNFVNSEPQVFNGDEILARVDFNLKPGTNLQARYFYQSGTEVSPLTLPAFARAEDGLEQEFSLGLTHTFNPRFLGSWKVEFRRETESQVPQEERSPGLLESLGISGVSVSDPDNDGYPEFNLDGYADFGDENLPEGEVENQLSFDSGFTRTLGVHTLQFGGNIQFNQINNNHSPALERGVFDFTGDFTGDSFADFLLGNVDNAEHAIGESRQDFRSHSFELYLSDEWRIHPQWFLTLGLAYNYYGPYHSTRQNVSVFHPLEFEPPVTGQLVTVGTPEAKAAGLGDLPEYGANRPDKNDWAPRIGIAYRPFTDSRWVIRSSYALFYNTFQSWRYEDFLGRNVPFYVVENSQAPAQSSPLDFSSPFAAGTATELTVRDIQHDLPTSYIQEWNLSLENQLGEHWRFQFGYRGRRGLNEYRVLPANVPLPGPGDLQSRRPNPNFGGFSILSAGASSELHELTIEGGRRLADWYSLQFEFEWQREFDNNVGSGFSQPSDPRNLNAEWAPSGLPQFVFSLNFVIDLPFKQGRATGASAGLMELLMGGWRVSGISEFRSGRRFSPRIGGDPNNDGVRGDRPDRLGPQQADFIPTVDEWFDTSLYVPAVSEFGTAGRNTLVSPEFRKWDVSLVKEVFFETGHRLQTRFSFFNAFNQTSFNQPNRTLGTSTFGIISSAREAREIEIALRYIF